MSAESALGSTRTPLVNDLRAGFLVFLIALPLCLGISLASGFPPVAGIITAIVGGCLSTWLGSARLTIKGPAAGLIVIAIGAVTELGGGDLVAGYHRALAVGVVAAVIQIAFASLRLANLGITMSRSVVHGMLAAIGVIIIAKQSHVLMGVKPESKEIVDLLQEIPHSLTHANPEVLIVGLVSLALLLIWPRLRGGWAKAIPAPLVVLAVSVPLSAYFHLGVAHAYYFGGHAFNVGPHYLVQLPSHLMDSIAFPDFSMVTSAISIKYILMFALVGSIESTLSVVAVDALDPQRRSSNLNRDLMAVGVGNLVAALLGGLPMISEIVRSKANVDAGATSPKANFVHGLCLLVFASLAPGLLGFIPLAALAAMLVNTGARLASPRELVHVSHIGMDQLALFLTTMLVTLFTDLLIGVGSGLALKVLLHFLRGATPGTLFASRLEMVEDDEGVRIRIAGTATFPSLLRIRKLVAELPEDVSRLVVDVAEARLVDHTFFSGLADITRSRPAMEVVFLGLDDFQSASAHPHASRWRSRQGGRA